MPYGTDVRGAIRILYIDDDEALGALVSKVLGRQGHTVVHVTHSTAALDQLATTTFDVIALDHDLIGETGISVLARIGPRGERPPVIYVTGSSDARIAVESMKAGADDYIVKDASGEFYELLVASAWQVIERWRLRQQRAENERATRLAKEHAEILLKEVNHRIANSLGLVAAMVRMQANALTDSAAVAALQETQTRISAVAGVHRWLYTSENVGQVRINDYLSHLVSELQTSLADPSRPLTITLQSDPLLLPTDKVVSLGVIIGELVTNAFKYAYNIGDEGEVRIILKQGEEGQVTLMVEDDGRGFDPKGTALGTGLGSKILKAMSRALNAEVIYIPLERGTRALLEFSAT